MVVPVSRIPDLIEGLDTLAAMRDTQPLLIDLLERPEWVHDALRLLAAIELQGAVGARPLPFHQAGEGRGRL